MRCFAVLFFLMISSPACPSTEAIDRVLVVKSDKKMYLFSNGRTVREYQVALGGNPIGHKLRQGDQRTPEGQYLLDYKKADSAYYRAIHISYPDEADIARAQANGVDPGGFIMIHGQKNGYGWPTFVSRKWDWTDGCIAVTNSEMDEIWRLVEEGTPIEIKP